MPLISNIKAEEILDSRGEPTLKVDVITDSSRGSFSVPSGASTGAHEALAIDTKQAIKNVEAEIAPALLGMDAAEQESVDEKMRALDGTENKSRLGANAIIGVSVACAKAAAGAAGKEVFEYLQGLKDIKPSRSTPYLFINLINGGKHSDSNLAFQEYHVIPQVDNVAEALEIGKSIRRRLGEVLGPGAKIGDEGGFAPGADSVRRPLELLKQAIHQAGCAGSVRLGLDVAASSFYKDGSYEIEGKGYDKESLGALYGEFVDAFSLFSIEDPFFEDDFTSFAGLHARHPDLLVVGDDLTVTNKERLQEAINQKSINGIIIKPNQIGTLTETLETMKMARDNDIECIVSHRSGETGDNFIADLACAFGSYGLKAGAPSQPERLVKYNRLIEIIDH